MVSSFSLSRDAAEQVYWQFSIYSSLEAKNKNNVILWIKPTRLILYEQKTRLCFIRKYETHQVEAQILD